MHPMPVNTAFGSHSGDPNAPDPSEMRFHTVSSTETGMWSTGGDYNSDHGQRPVAASQNDRFLNCPALQGIDPPRAVYLTLPRRGRLMDGYTFGCSPRKLQK